MARPTKSFIPDDGFLVNWGFRLRNMSYVGALNIHISNGLTIFFSIFHLFIVKNILNMYCVWSKKQHFYGQKLPISWIVIGCRQRFFDLSFFSETLSTFYWAGVLFRVTGSKANPFANRCIPSTYSAQNCSRDQLAVGAGTDSARCAL